MARLWALPRRDRMLLLRAVLTVLFVRLVLPCSSVEGLRRWTSRFGHGTMPLARIVWAVEAASRAVAGTKCLAAALTLQRLLSAHRIASELRIGVALHDGKFGAHAWVMRNGEILIGEDSHREYSVLTNWTTDPKSGSLRTGETG